MWQKGEKKKKICGNTITEIMGEKICNCDNSVVEYEWNSERKFWLPKLRKFWGPQGEWELVEGEEKIW